MLRLRPPRGWEKPPRPGFQPQGCFTEVQQSNKPALDVAPEDLGSDPRLSQGDLRQAASPSEPRIPYQLNEADNNGSLKVGI